MVDIGIRALKQNASAVVAEAAAGEEIVITDRGRPVARLTAVPRSRLSFLIDAGLVRPPRRDIASLAPPTPLEGADGDASLSAALLGARDDERC